MEEPCAGGARARLISAGANYRSYKALARTQVSLDAYSTDPLGPGSLPSLPDATTISETNPLMINKGVRHVAPASGQLVR